jgi:hypothetical protein
LFSVDSFQRNNFTGIFISSHENGTTRRLEKLVNSSSLRDESC